MYKLIIIFISLNGLLFTHAHDFHPSEKPEQSMTTILALDSKDANNYSQNSNNHSQKSKNYVKYLGNEALFINVNHNKILFDPFFHDNIRIYQLVPDSLKSKINNGIAPFNHINVIFISHAHRDHFAVDEVVNYLLEFPDTKLVAPQQAIDKVTAHLTEGDALISPERLVGVKLDFGDQPWQLEMENLTIDAVRIPHAGWPSRADIENIVFRVTLNDSSTIMHMGDADPDDNHYLPYKAFWQKKSTDINFPPYWFLYSAEGRDIIDNIIGAKANVGIHVPMEVPRQLSQSGRDYFSVPDENKSL
ncbi:MAG: MBL fold metallo-hydrolase [Thalassotalea sp.]|nr:MBL fold metallo-hydrolase [Thalassotalea sp.]